MMVTNRRVAVMPWTLALALAAGPAMAQSVKGKLEGFQEVPAIFSPGTGKCSVKQRSGLLAVTLDYSGLLGTASQAHIHFGQPGVNGGIMLFICSNLGNGPVGTPACPVSGTVTRNLGPTDVVGGASAQGIAAGDFAAVGAAMKKKAAYCNVHSDLYPGGEIRAQLK